MKKSIYTKAAADLSELFVELRKKALKRDITDEQFGKAITDGDTQEKWIDIIAARVNGAKNLALKSLKLITDGIVIAGKSFTKDSFFTVDGPVEFYFGDNFKKLILSVIPDSIPIFQGKFLKTQLTEYMYDSAILNELGNPKPFTVGEFAAIIRNLLTKQPKGENGELLNSGYANIFYVQLEDKRVVAVSAYWHSGDRGWHLSAGDLDVDRWYDGSCVFSRS